MSYMTTFNNIASDGNSVDSANLGDLPEGWDIGRDFDGKIYFIDHNNKRTTWTDPRSISSSR
jgi:hypothetical protein